MPRKFYKLFHYFKKMDNDKIFHNLPHTFPFIFIDKILQIDRGKRAEGLKNVSHSDNFLWGHFPGEPVVPGVVVVEALAQLSGMIFEKEGGSSQRIFLVEISRMKFKRVIKPGDQLFLKSEVAKKIGKLCKFEVSASVDEEIVTIGEITLSF